MFSVETVSARIREARIRKNMTQNNLADELGVSYQAVSNWERGNSMPDISKYEDLCRILDVSLEYLLGMGSETNTVEKILDNKNGNMDIKTEELVTIASLLPPNELKERVEENAEKELITAETLMGLAPFLDRKSLDDMAEKVVPSSFGELIGIAPFISRDMLSLLYYRLEDKDNISVDLLMGIAPFLDRAILDELACKLKISSIGEIVGLAPFISKGVLSELIKKCTAR